MQEGDEPPMQYAWNWAAVQLDNEVEISAAILVDPRSESWRIMETRVVIVDPQGNRHQPTDLLFESVGECYARRW